MYTMGVQKYEKLNQLQSVLPEGFPVDSGWLQKRGYSRQLIAKYLRHNWLESPTRGVYRRPTTIAEGDSWQPVVLSIQTLLVLPITVGGRTALELQGLTHYLSLSDIQEVHLYASKAPPNWIHSLPVKQEFVVHSANLIKAPASPGLASALRGASFIEQRWGMSDWSMLISTPERAILEVIDELPNKESFHQVDVLMEGLSNLRPKYVTNLLSCCRSVKTKRLFLWFADRHRHSWLSEIDISKIDIGSGKRMLVPGGKLDSKYLITVPGEFSADV